MNDRDPRGVTWQELAEIVDLCLTSTGNGRRSVFDGVKFVELIKRKTGLVYEEIDRRGY